MIEHKAFLFDYNTFDRELRPLLESALVTSDCSGLSSFVSTNLSVLRGPYEGQPLDTNTNWETMIETHDAHQYGDFALMKYYDPTADIGLGSGWRRVQELVASNPALPESPILGHTIGSNDNPFDPGKMGSYFQAPYQVQDHYRYVSTLARRQESDALRRAIEMLESVARAKTGLYVTF